MSGLWLLSGMRDDGVLTTIDIEPEHQRIAKQGVQRGGVGQSRTRLIAGRAQEVLTRLADESYDLVFIDAAPADQPDFVVEGVRLLRPGRGHRRAPGRPRGPCRRPGAADAEVSAVREAARLIAEDERLTPFWCRWATESWWRPGTEPGTHARACVTCIAAAACRRADTHARAGVSP